MKPPARRDRPPEVVYSPESRILNPGLFLRSVAHDVVNSRELAWQLFWRDINQRYRQSLLGVLWVLIPPLATTLIFVFLNERKILNVGVTDIPYPVYVMLGTLLWQVFTESVMTPLKVFDSCVSIMIKINMPREAPILAGIEQVLFYMGLQLLVAFGALVWFDMPLTWSLLLALPAILVLVLLGTAVGLFLVPLGALYKDVGEGIGILIRFAFFLTPIVYPPPQSWPYSLLVNLNPVTPLLLGARDLMAKGSMGDPSAFFIATGGTVVALVLAFVFYRLSVPIILERLGA